MDTFTPITILLIEDNPAQEGIKAKDLKSHGIDIGSLDENIDVPGINFKKNKNLHHLFTLKVLQHPEEIKEYISNCLEKEDKEGSVSLGNTIGVVPEIVEFDYKLSDNITINREKGKNDEVFQHIKYWSSYKKLREYYNPNFLLNNEQHLEKKENQNYTVKDFIERINYLSSADGEEDWYKKDIQELDEDQLGLYAGVEITRIFRNHVCVGIPATSNYDSRERLHVFGKFYEWMNEYDLGTMFSREERGNKDWDSVISAAVKQLRIRIETQLQSNKITLNLTQLLVYANEIPTKQEERIFTFQSAYGVRHLPLDGLFIDVEADKRDEAIKNFAEKCLNIHLKNAQNGLTKDVLDNALKFAKDLLEQYDNKDKFLKRIRFSQLKDMADKSTITEEQKTELCGIYDELGMDKKAKEYKDAFDLRNYTGANDNSVKRYAALFVMVNVYKRYVGFKKNNESKQEFKGKPYLFTAPDKMDYLLAIYPRPETPLVLPLHGRADGLDKDLKRNTSLIVGEEKGISITSVLKCTEEGGISKGEKRLLQSYALGIDLNTDDFAEWFKNS